MSTSAKLIIKKVFCFCIAIWIGSFVNTVMENDPNINIWIARSCGCITSGISGVMLYYLFLNRSLEK